MSKEFDRRSFITGKWGQETGKVAAGGVVGFLAGELQIEPEEVEARLETLENVMVGVLWRQDNQGRIINTNADILQWVVEQISTTPGQYREPDRDAGTAQKP